MKGKCKQVDRPMTIGTGHNDKSFNEHHSGEGKEAYIQNE